MLSIKNTNLKRKFIWVEEKNLKLSIVGKNMCSEKMKYKTLFTKKHSG